MKKNILVKVGERTEIRERIVPAVYGDNGELLTPETVEQYTVTVPIMEARNVEMTAEEIAEMERQQAELPELSPSELREQAYNTDQTIPWGSAMLTVTQAAQQWAYYAAEGHTDKTDALTALIAAAKEKIRAEWPDGEEQDHE